MARVAYAFLRSDEPDAFSAVLGRCAGDGLLRVQADDPLYGIVEDDAEICFDTIACDDGAWHTAKEPERDLGSWPRGRVFGAAGELRWQTHEEWVHLVLTTDAEPPIPHSLEGIVELGQGEDEPHLLWGEWERDAWREGQVPDDLDYPVDAPDRRHRAWIRARVYRDARGEVAFTRYVALTTASAEKPPALDGGGKT